MLHTEVITIPEFVNIPVPVDRVQEVYELLAKRPAAPAATHSVSENGYINGWSPELIDRMFVESSSSMRRILLAIANASPRWVATSEIAEVTGLTSRQVVASFGPFEKRVRGRYGMSHWPFVGREFVDAGSVKYSMTPETATRILELTAEAAEREAQSS